MLISEAIKELEGFRKKHGDRPIHLEIGEDVTCGECGCSKYESMTGMLKSIGHINIHEIGICVYLLADRG